MDNSLDRISYALGLSMGNNFKASGIKEINVKDFADGVAAVFEGAAPKMSYDEAKKEIAAYRMTKAVLGAAPAANDLALVG